MTALYGILMLLPQSEAFRLIQNRLVVVVASDCSLRYPHATTTERGIQAQVHTGNRIVEVEVGVAGAVMGTQALTKLVAVASFSREACF